MNSLRSKLGKITKKYDYNKMKAGSSIITAGFILQARNRYDKTLLDPKVIRYGLTCSKRIGNAVKRNRAKRRLRALITNIIPFDGLNGWDYVLIGREHATEQIPFKILEQDLKQALFKLHNKESKKREKD